MSQIENRIRSLHLKRPSESMDVRILSLLTASDQPNDSPPASPEKSIQEMSPIGRPSNGSYLNGSSLPPVPADGTPDSCSPATRRGAVVTSGWIVACASMLLGGFVGNTLPSVLELTSRESSQHQAGHVMTDGEMLNPENSREISFVNAKAGADDISHHSPGRTSQIVESIWLSPAAAAVVWEQQTGQIFNVVNHVNDRRFDMCRDCHRVGG